MSDILRVRFDTAYFVENWKQLKINKKLLFIRLAQFISLKSLFMENEQCQTRVQEKKKKKTQKLQCKKRNTQTPPKYHPQVNLVYNVRNKVNKII